MFVKVLLIKTSAFFMQLFKTVVGDNSFKKNLMYTFDFLNMYLSNAFLSCMLFCSSKVESAHKEFKKAIGAAVCKYNAEKKSLQIIVSCENFGYFKRIVLIYYCTPNIKTVHNTAHEKKRLFV